MYRQALLFRLKNASLIGEYKKRHEHVWPEVESALKKSGMKNYSIWNLGELLIGYCEYESEAAAKHAVTQLAEDEYYLKWRDYMEDIIYVETDGNKEYPLQLTYLLE